MKADPLGTTTAGKRDGRDFAVHVEGFGKAFMEAWRASRTFVDSLPGGDGRLVIAGLGGSAAAGDIAAAVVAQRGWDGVTVLRGHTLPSWMTAADLLLICSYSGETHETGLAFEEARAARVPVGIVTAGGHLEQEARAAGTPRFAVQYDSAPRHALAWLMAPLLGAAARRSGDRGLWLELADAAGSLHRSFALESTVMRSRARSLAAEAAERIVVVTAAEHMSAAARRWKNQLNENAKHAAFCEELPEAAHNSIEAVGGNTLHVVLWSGSYSERAKAVARGYIATLEAAGAPVVRVHCGGLAPAAELLSTVMLGDLMSLELAVTKAIDPGPIPRIEAAKRATGGTWPSRERSPAV